MKLNIRILPEFHLNKTEEEMKDEFKSFYTGNNKTEGWIVNNTLYLAAFLIPFVLLLMMMNYFGFAPFGAKSMFVIDGATDNIPVLTKAIAQIRNGSFQLFTLSGSAGSEQLSSLAYYLASPFTLFTLLFNQKTAVGLLSLFCVLRISLSAPVFLYYLTHCEIGRRGSKYDVTLLIFSLGYAMSSYALVQFSDFMYLDCFVLFPLLILGLERIMTRKSMRLFYIVMSFCLFSNFYMGLMLILFCSLYCLFMHKAPAGERLRGLLVSWGVCLLCACTSAVTVIPGLLGLYKNVIAGSVFPLHSFHQNFFQMFIQQFFFNDPSYLRVAQYGCNLYAGVIVLPLVCLHFLNKTVPVKKRISDAVLFVLLVFALNDTSVSHLLHFKVSYERSFHEYGFVLIFLLLLWSFDAFKCIRDIPLWRVPVASVIPIGLALLAMNLTKPAPNFSSVNFTIDILIALAILLMLYRLGSIKRKTFYLILTVFTLIELIANSFQSVCVISLEEAPLESLLTAEDANPLYGSLSDGRSELYTGQSDAEQNMNHLFSRFGTNLLLNDRSEPAYNPLEDSLRSLKYLYTPADSNEVPNSAQYTLLEKSSDFKIYKNRYAFPTAFLFDEDSSVSIDPADSPARLNSLAKRLGAKGDIYEEIPLDITIGVTESKKDYIGYRSLGNQMFSFYQLRPDGVSDEDYPSIFKIRFQFTAPRDGKLYLLFDTLDYFDSVKAGREYEFLYYDPLDPNFDHVASLKGYYFHEELLEELKQKLGAQACAIEKDGLWGMRIRTQSESAQTLLSILPFTQGCKVGIDGQTCDYHELDGRIAVSLPQGEHTVTIRYTCVPFTIGLLLTGFSLLCLAVVLLTRKKAEALAPKLSKADERITCALARFAAWCGDNYVYLLAFLVPFTAFLVAMILMNAAPFGNYSFFSDDGIQIVLPGLYASVEFLRSHAGSLHTWIGGGGRSYAPNVPLFFRGITLENITVSLQFFIISIISLSGVSLVFYLTHRLLGRRAHKKDYRLLVAALCYSMSNYSLLMLNNYSWYYAFVLFPLVLLGMDYLMLRGKKRYYILFLALTIIWQNYISMFICIYLVIRFFTYPFDSFKDFLKKGVRFALSSLFMLGLGAKAIFGVVNMMSTSTYGSEYSEGLIFPKEAWFSHFSFLFKQQMFLPDTFTVSWFEGDVNLYFGILGFILLFAYLLARKISLKEKLRNLVPFLILYITINQPFMNYVMNGLHYQNGVPNRFVFLVTMMAGVIGYDLLRSLKKQNVLSILFAVLLAAGAFVYAYFDSEPSDALTRSFLISCILCGIYLLLLLLARLSKKHRHLWGKLLVGAFCLELAVNACLTIQQHRQNTSVLTYSKEASDYLKEQKGLDQTLERVSQRSSLTQNYALLDQDKSLHLFSAGSISVYQQKAAEYSGCSTGSNILMNASTPTIMGDSFGCNRYLIVNNIGQYRYGHDMADYKLIGITEKNYILENPYCFPFAYYLPGELMKEQESSRTSHDVWETINQYVTPEEASLVDAFPLYRKDGMPEGEENYYTEFFRDNRHIIRVHLAVPISGSAYLQLSDFQYLGEQKEGDVLDFDVDITDYHESDTPSTITICILHKDTFFSLYEAIRQNPLMITDFTNDTIDGSIQMPADGVIHFSMPYDTSWKAYVDGEPAETIAHANAFLAVPASKGSHSVRLEYRPAQKKLSVIAYYFSWCSFALAVLLSELASRGKISLPKASDKKQPSDIEAEADD